MSTDREIELAVDNRFVHGDGRSLFLAADQCIDAYFSLAYFSL